MVFSFDMVRPRRSITLPSVESWSTNTNIIKDPPKSIFTRRINKVGSDNKLMNTIRAGSDRFAENIQIYPRGVNPSVSVSYNNTGITNGTNAMPQIQSSLPYKAFDHGAFRPPAIEGGLRSMLPLSRMNRLNTSSLANKSNRNVVLNHAKCEPTKKIIHKNILKIQQKAASSHNIQPSIKNYKVKHVVANPVSAFANTHRKENKYINNSKININRYINSNYNTTFANSNLAGKKVDSGKNNITVEKIYTRYIKRSIQYY